MAARVRHRRISAVGVALLVVAASHATFAAEDDGSGDLLIGGSGTIESVTVDYPGPFTSGVGPPTNAFDFDNRAPFDEGGGQHGFGQVWIPGSAPTAAVGQPGADFFDTLVINAFDVDPGADSERVFYTGTSLGGPPARVYFFRQPDDSLAGVATSSHDQPLQVHVQNGRGGPNTLIDLGGVDDDSESRSGGFIARFTVDPRPEIGRLAEVDANGNWKGSQGATSYKSPVTLSESKRGKGIDSYRIRKDQKAKRLRGRRRAYYYKGRGHIEGTIPVDAQTKSGKNQIVINALVGGAAAQDAPTAKQLARALEELEQTDLERILDRVRRNKPLKGKDRLGFGRSADFWSLQLVTTDDAEGQAAVDDILGHRGWEVPPADPSLAPFGVQVQPADGDPARLTLDSGIWPEHPSFADDLAGDTSVPYIDFYSLDGAETGAPRVSAVVIRDDALPEAPWGEMDQNPPPIQIYTIDGPVHPEELTPAERGEADPQQQSFDLPASDDPVTDRQFFIFP